MDNIKIKIKLFFLPYLIISVSTLVGWTFLHWLLFIKLNVYSVDERILTIVVPLALSFIFTMIWLNKRIKLLKLESKTGIINSLYMLVPIFVIGIQSLFAQQYIEKASGKLTSLANINEVEKKEPTKYYTLKSFYLDKKHFSIKKHYSVYSGKRQRSTMNVYFAVPILNSVKDTAASSNCIAWYCKVYSKSTDFGTESLNQSESLNQFVEESMMKFDGLDVNQFEYLERRGKTESSYDNFISAIKNNTKYKTKSEIILVPSTEPFENRGDEDFSNTLLVFGGGTLLFLIMILLAKMKKPEEEEKNTLFDLAVKQGNVN